MSAPTTAPPAQAPAREHIRHRWRQWRFLVLAAVILLVLSAVVTALTVRTSDRALGPDNPGGNGGRALAQILTAQGVDVREAGTVAEAAALAGPGTTLFVTSLTLLTEEQRADLVQTGADLVLTGATYTSFDGLAGVEGRLEPSGEGSNGPVEARCDVPAAEAAGTISGSVGSVVATGAGVSLCFPVSEEAAAYATLTAGGATVHYVADQALLTNDELAKEGNAALALHILGARQQLVWFVPSPVDTTTAQDQVPMVPPPLATALWMLLVAFLALALWQGRRLGPVVTEELPVVVRSAETTRGRGRLYRRFGAHGHAAASLRAGTANRVARELGLPRSAGAEQLVDALERQTSRPAPELRALLYGPAPTDDAGLLALAGALDTLEREVHRP